MHIIYVHLIVFIFLVNQLHNITVAILNKEWVLKYL
jgi:hypothetical protein